MTPPEDHATTAASHIAKADDWANRDRVEQDFRSHMVDYHLRLAQVHATLAVAQQISLWKNES